MNPVGINFHSDIVPYSKFSKFTDFHNLMQFRVRDILLVSSLYDSFIFEEDGRLYELIREEYHYLNLSHSPELVQVSSGEKAIQLLKTEQRFDLIITTQHVEDMSALIFAKRVKDADIRTPIVLLGYDNRELEEMLREDEIKLFEKVFIWQGDYRIILGIIKFLEDKYNVERDVANVGVQVILLIEDSIMFYSSYLPLVYTQILKQAQSLLAEGVNLSHKFLRMRARPKILLCSTYEEAEELFKKYEDHILGVISDINFPRNGKNDPLAGIKFTRMIKQRHDDIPVLLQSNVNENEESAFSAGASFILKDSPTLLQDLSAFMREQFSFGPFIFRDKLGREVARAANLTELEKVLKDVPEESLVYHASRNHFSNWLKARTEFWLAHVFRPKKVSDFSSAKELRKHIIKTIKNYRKTRVQGIITDFDKNNFDPQLSFARIGGGSIGGKARGLGFVNRLLSDFDLRTKFKNVNIFVPTTIVIGSEVFDDFLDSNDLREFALRSENDSELLFEFLNANYFPIGPKRQLTEFLEIVTTPIAVRSSSLLEDSQGQPFAGVYDTYMLPNNNKDIEYRVEQLLRAIKKIYASIFSQKSKDYISVTSYRSEEEKMAIVIQKVVGAEHNGKYYPEVCGVARSFNFYPAPPLTAEDGIVLAAFGLGKTIAEGGKSVRFCPKYPHHLLQFGNIEDTLNFSPKDFYAIDMSGAEQPTEFHQDGFVRRHDLQEAEPDGTLYQVGSTYSPENEAIYDGVSRNGIRLITLSPMLKFHTFPLPEIIEVLLDMGAWGMSSPVEIEFVVNLSVPKGKPKEFAVLQMRPLVVDNELDELDLDIYPDKDLVCKSNNVLGNGITNNISDILFVDRTKYDRGKSQIVAQEIAQFNSKLVKQGRRYLLVTVGRLGTFDPWLGIPLPWEHISGAKTIIESNFRDFNVTPSQGSHFFQNLTSFKVGYFTVNSYEKEGFVNWDWLLEQKKFEEAEFTAHVRLNSPLTIKINGQQGKGVIIKPGKRNKYNHEK